MSEKFACPECGQLHRWKPEFAGKRAKCKCGGVITVPDQPSAPAAPPAMEQAPVALADDAGSAASFDAVSPGGCPACGAAIADGAVLCVACGYNLQTGQQIGTAVETAPPHSTPGVALAVPSMLHRAKIDENKSADNGSTHVKGWGSVGLGALSVILGIWQYFDLEDGEPRLGRFGRTAYRIGGRWGVVIGFCVLGLALVVIGILEIKGKLSASEDE